MFGCFAGAWAVGALDVERTFDLTDAELGFLLAAGILAGTAIAAFAGAITDRLGARAATARGLVMWPLLIAVAACAPTLGAFAPVYVLAIGAGGFLDVVLNVVAADALSHEPGRLVRFHGLWNAGAVAGAAVTGIALRLGASWRAVWIFVAMLGLVTSVFVRRTPMPALPAAEHPSLRRSVAELRHEGLVVLAIVFALGAMVEGGIATWGVLYLRDHLQLGVLAGVSAFVVGASLATLARIGGGGVVGALGARRAIALGATLSAVGLAACASATNAALAATGLAAAAVGISVVWPLLIAEVNNRARRPALAIGGVTAFGYLGMVAGPPVVGMLSAWFGLRVGLLALAAAAVFVAATPAHVRARARAATAAAE